MSYIGPTKVFAHLDRLVAWRGGDRPSPVTVEFDLSNSCSLACWGCHFSHTHLAGPFAAKKDLIKPAGYADTGKLADLEMVFRALTEMADAGVQAIVWTGGGEPTLHTEWVSAVQFGRVCGLKQGMYTLGGHLDADKAKVAGLALDWVVVSLDAPDAETYAQDKGVPAARFANACEGVKLLAAQPDLVVGVSFLLHAGNWTRAEEMLVLARSLGATYATFRPTIETRPGDLTQIAGDREWVTAALPTLWALHAEPNVEIDPDRFIEYRDWVKHPYATCYGIRLVTQITPDGRVWICPNRRGIAGSELGDLRKESFAAVWKRHPGKVTEFSSCRAMCRLHSVNTVLADVERPRSHEAFI